jgi:hypothetical protein
MLGNSNLKIPFIQFLKLKTFESEQIFCKEEIFIKEQYN